MSDAKQVPERGTGMSLPWFIDPDAPPMMPDAEGIAIAATDSGGKPFGVCFIGARNPARAAYIVTAANAFPGLVAACDAPEWNTIWELLNAFASGETQKQWARVEPLAVLGEVYQALAIIDTARRAALSAAR